MLALSLAKISAPVRRVRHKFRQYPKISDTWTLPSGQPLKRPIRMYLQNGSDRIAASLYAKGWSHEVYQIRMFEQALRSWRPGNVLDVGANTGLYSILSKAVSPRQVYAIEPIPTIAEMCRENIVLNNADVTVYTLAASDRKGAATIHLPDRGFGAVETSASLSTTMHTHQCSTAEIETDTIDNLFSGKTISIMKIDVEGFENAVIRGSLGTMQRCRPITFCEILTQIRYDLGDLPNMLESVGYRRAAITPDGILRQSGHDFAKDVFDYLLYPADDEEIVDQINRA